VKHFDRELENNKIVMEALLSIDGTKILSEYPIGLTQLEEQTGRSKYKKDRE
jgi:Sep-tRNA:Cys-tRNA synthetase